MSELPISVVESAKDIASRAKHVTISSEGVNATARKLYEVAESVSLGEPEGCPALLEPAGLSDSDLLNWIFLLDTLNFCFWSDENVLFTVDFRNERWTGYRALVAALSRAVEGGVPVYEPSYYGHVTLDELEEIFKSETHVPIPLLEQRLNCLHEVAAILETRDVASYEGQTVAFLKRAQILAADLWDRFGGNGYGEFSNIEELTMFADYRVPQSLQYFGVLHYSNELMTKLRSGVHLPQGSAEEVEIRGCSIWAVELIKHKIHELCLSHDTSGPSHRRVYSVSIDYYLWKYAKTHSKLMTQFPIHRTKTIFY
jgi:hypothetical protein